MYNRIYTLRIASGILSLILLYGIDYIRDQAYPAYVCTDNI